MKNFYVIFLLYLYVCNIRRVYYLRVNSILNLIGLIKYCIGYINIPTYLCEREYISLKIIKCDKLITQLFVEI